MIDGKPRQGLAGKVAFVHPRACARLLVELVTPSERASLPEAPLALSAVHGKVEDVRGAAQRFQDLFGMARGFAAEARAAAHAARRWIPEAGVDGAAGSHRGRAGAGPASRGAWCPVPGACGRTRGRTRTGAGGAAHRGARSLMDPRGTRA
jgi:hypothetical protein